MNEPPLVTWKSNILQWLQYPALRFNRIGPRSDYAPSYTTAAANYIFHDSGRGSPGNHCYRSMLIMPSVSVTSSPFYSIIHWFPNLTKSRRHFHWINSYRDTKRSRFNCCSLYPVLLYYSTNCKFVIRLCCDMQIVNMRDCRKFSFSPLFCEHLMWTVFNKFL